MDVVAKATKFLLVLGNTCRRALNRLYGLLSMNNHLIGYLHGRFAKVWLSVPVFFCILNNHFTLRRF